MSKRNSRFVSVADAAELTGLSKETLRKLEGAGRLKAHRLAPKKLMLDRAHLEEMIQKSMGGARKKS